VILWFLLDNETQEALRRAFPRIKPPKLEAKKRDISFTPIIRLEAKKRDISFTPIIRIEEIERTMRQIPKGPGR